MTTNRPVKTENHTNTKVLIVRDRPSAGGGICNYYEAVSDHLQAEHYFSDVARPHTFYGGRVPIWLRWTPLRLGLDWIALFLRILRYWPDIVHVNPGLDPSTGKALRRDAVCVLIARLLRRPVLVFWRGWHSHWLGNPDFPGGNGRWLHRTYLKGAAHVVLASRFKEELRRWGFKAPIYVETTLVSDECLFAKSGSQQADSEVINLLYLSRIEVAKGVFELLDTYRILKEENPAYTLTIAGDGPAMEDLREYAAKLGLADVSFPGFLSGDEKMECFRKGAVFCFMSYTEGMPNAVLEAMAFGLPIVSSDAGGLRDILRNGETGYVIPSREDAPLKERFDPAEVAERIKSIVTDPATRMRISAYNWSYARERFAAEKVAERLDDLYLDLEPAEGLGTANTALSNPGLSE